MSAYGFDPGLDVEDTNFEPHQSSGGIAIPSAPSDLFTHLPLSFGTSQRVNAGLAPGQSMVGANPAAPLHSARARQDSQGRALNPRSCVTCRRRKVKCDKTHPCANCTRAGIECVFPAPGRAPRRPRKPDDARRDQELLDRLRRLEGMFKGMGSSAAHHDSDEQEHAEEETESAQHVSSDGMSAGHDSSTMQKRSSHGDIPWHEKSRLERAKAFEDYRTGQFENRFGRLVVNEGKSRYINNSFWANLSNEVEDLKGLLKQSSDEEDESTPSASTPSMSTHQGWIFGFNSTDVDLLSFHPLPSQVNLYWHTFKDRVDLLVKVLHIPTAEKLVLDAASHLSSIPKSLEVLLFAIYYGATTSSSSQECLSRFGEERSTLLSRYRFGLEQSLARANFLTTEEMQVLQGFVIFLICLRRNSDARAIWTLTGLIVRIAQTMGIHRDGSHFGLSPFEIELRRRLWWQVCILDTRASEDHGCDPTIVEQAFDTKLPLNINDVDITPDMEEYPRERQGCTDMSFCLIRFEVANTFRRLNYVPPAPLQGFDDKIRDASLKDKEQWITACHERIEDKYLKHCDMSIPMYWVTATVARLMMSKMWLMVYHPFQRQDGGLGLSPEMREKLFITSLENIEYSLLLETEARTMKWGWLFKTYMQWHALAFLLSELCKRTSGDLVERAWIAVEKTRDGRWTEVTLSDSPAGHLWRPLKKLYRRAKEMHEQGQPMVTVEQHGDVDTGGGFGAYGADLSRRFQKQSSLSTNTSTPDKPKLIRLAHEPQASPDSSEMSGGVACMSELYANCDQGMAAAMPHVSLSQAYTGSQDLNVQAPAQSATNDMSFIPLNTNGLQQQLPPLPASMSIVSNTAPSGVVLPNLQTNPFGTALDLNVDNTSPDIDMSSVMDTSGNLDWDSWDQLVRQFGTDADAPMTVEGGVPADWGGGNWDFANMMPTSGGDNGGFSNGMGSFVEQSKANGSTSRARRGFGDGF